MGNLTAPELERFQARVRIESDGGCRVWTGPLDKDGYGMFFLRRKNRRAHRVAWYDMHGEKSAALASGDSAREHASRLRHRVGHQRPKDPLSARA